MSHSTLVARMIKGTILAALVALLAACGISSPSQAAHTVSTAMPSVTATPTLSTTLRFNSAASVDVDGLHIQTSGVDCGAWFVLNGQQRAYDSGTIQQMKAYAEAFVEKYYLANETADPGSHPPVTFTSQFAAMLPRLPSSWQVVPGSDFNPRGQCTGLFDITNIGTTDIQISSFGATLAAMPVPNNTDYRLVNVCTLIEQQWPCAGLFGGGPICDYAAYVNLQSGQVGTHFDAPVKVDQGDGTCSTPITVAPGKVVEIYLKLVSKSALLYTVSLALTLNTGAGATTVDLPSAFNTSLAFANDGQFSCYGLQGSTFVVEDASILANALPLCL